MNTHYKILNVSFYPEQALSVYPAGVHSSVARVEVPVYEVEVDVDVA